ISQTDADDARQRAAPDAAKDAPFKVTTEVKKTANGVNMASDTASASSILGTAKRYGGDVGGGWLRPTGDRTGNGPEAVRETARRVGLITRGPNGEYQEAGQPAAIPFAEQPQVQQSQPAPKSTQQNTSEVRQPSDDSSLSTETEQLRADILQAPPEVFSKVI